MSTARERYESILERIERACAAAGRHPEDVTLVAVSKTFPPDSIRELYELGHRTFGESRLQEAQAKIETLPDDIEWHFVGKLQSNKAKRVAMAFPWIQTIESESQLREISKSERTVNGLVEINIGKEPQKSGILPENLTNFAGMVLQYPTVILRGIMTIGPADSPPDEARRLFSEMRKLRDSLLNAPVLSMGMSGDFELAIMEGATHVRIGTALFGDR